MDGLQPAKLALKPKKNSKKCFSLKQAALQTSPAPRGLMVLNLVLNTFSMQIKPKPSLH
jgi:hypothetical protein